MFLKPQSNGNSHQLPQIITILIGSLAGISEGLLFSWTSPAIPELVGDSSMNISFEEVSYLPVITTAAMIIGAPFCSLLVNVIGRKRSLLLLAVPQIVVWILIGFAKNIWVFYIARIICGIAEVGFFSTVPLYVSEITQPKVRGTWGNLVAISLQVGIFLINVIGAYNDIPTTAMICGCLPLIQLILCCFIPESPYYLLMKGREEDAKESLKLLRWTNNVEEEWLSLKVDVARQSTEEGTIKELLSIDSNRKALLMCLLIRFAQQFSGLSAFELYTQYLFQEFGSDISHKLSAIIFTGALLLCIALSAFFVERVGRRPLMIFSCFGCGIILSIEALYFTVKDFTNLDLSNFGWLPLLGMLIYIIVCASGVGILPNLVLGEIFSTSIKGKATSVVNIASSVCLLITPKLFQTLSYNVGMFSSFYFFAFCCFACGILSYFYVIETKGITLEEIQQKLKGNTMYIRTKLSNKEYVAT